jgi:hypothetical protein
MFSPEQPRPSKYRHSKPAPVQSGNGSVWIKRTLQILFIIIGLGAIAGLIIYSPKQKTMVCDKSLQVRGSLTAFGSCKAK